MSNTLSKKLLINTLWSIIGHFGYIAIGLISNIVLVRLLEPKDFGRIAIIMFFIAIFTVMIESGLSGALVRKQNATEIDYSTIFIFNLAVSIVLMILLIGFSGYISEFYQDPQLKYILMTSSLVLLFNALRITQTTKLIKQMRFKAKALYEFVAILFSSIVAIILAIRGFGVWALIFLQILTALTLTVILWVFVGPLKKYKFSFDSFKQFYKFGVNTTLASLLNTVFDNIYQLILAKYFTLSQTGYFYQSKKLQETPVGIIQSTVLGVIYSALSKLQDDSNSFNKLYQEIVRIFTIIVALICMLIYFYAEFIISTLYGDKWIESAIYLRLLIIAAFFYLQEIFNRIIFKVFDRTEKILQLEIIKKVVQTSTIIYGVWVMSIEVLLYGFLITSILSFFINYYFARKVQCYFSWKDFNTIIVVMISAIIVVLSNLFLVDYFNLNSIETLFILPLIIGSYTLILHIFGVVQFSKDLKKIKFLLSKGE